MAEGIDSKNEFRDELQSKDIFDHLFNCPQALDAQIRCSIEDRLSG